jgi:hypothetical protein
MSPPPREGKCESNCMAIFLNSRAVLTPLFYEDYPGLSDFLMPPESLARSFSLFLRRQAQQLTGGSLFFILNQYPE